MKKTNLSENGSSALPDGRLFKIGIIAAEWNPEVTDAMLEGAHKTLLQCGVQEDNVTTVRVPGTFELTTAADMMLASTPNLDAVICIGCVIQGETRHFEFICQAVSQGLTNVALRHGRPVIFSVLTTDNMDQALARSGGEHGNKGVEGAHTALKMCALQHSLQAPKK
ncbi:MAG: 6,7-dimethyl-8-ribityllumazine synthase [Bacteroidales bacterium]|nr:6,7-dimethyl-8-ribityllumazine synthase [Bacteroidales bacterium]